MKEQTDDDVTVHACEGCRSLWLSEGDLENKGVSMPPHVRFLEPKHPRPCPACGHPMGRLRARGIEIDRCAPCGGMYFDGGELESLRGGASASSASTGSLGQDVAEAAGNGLLWAIAEIIGALF